VLALLAAAMPLAMTMTSTILAIMEDGKVVQFPTIIEIQQAASVHVLAFTSRGELLVDESEGDFNLDDWNLIFEEAQRICCGAGAASGVDAVMDESRSGSGGLTGFLRSTLEAKVTTDLKWKK
jgi:exosome complex component RRP46